MSSFLVLKEIAFVSWMNFEKNFSEIGFYYLANHGTVFTTLSIARFFLLTTNAMTINENMVGRPSRIRYVKEFGNLDLTFVNEYLDDALQVPEARQDLLDFIDFFDYIYY